MLSNVYNRKNKVNRYGLIALLIVAIGLGDAFGQEKARSKKFPLPVADQFPVTKMWDEAVAAAHKSGRPALVFNVDYVDSNSILFRDKILRDLGVQHYLNETFELGVNDFSVNPPPTVGLDSLRNLGLRLDALEKGFNITERPTAIMLLGDTTEVDRIVHPERLTPTEFITALNDYLAGRNTLAEYRSKFWNDTTNDDARLAYLNKLADHSEVDSLLWHLSVLSHVARDPSLAHEAGKQYAYVQFQMTSQPRHLEKWIARLDRKKDSMEIYDALLTMLEFQERTKRVDSIAVAYDRVFMFTGERDPDLLNNLAWAIVNFSTRRDSALALVNEAIAKNAKNANYFDTRALIYFFKDDFDAAAREAKIAVSLAATEEDKTYYLERMGFYEREAKDKREFLDK